jgi:hypothetical protein
MRKGEETVNLQGWAKKNSINSGDKKMKKFNEFYYDFGRAVLIFLFFCLRNGLIP